MKAWGRPLGALFAAFLAAPLVLALAFGVWNPLAAIELSGLHFVIARLTRPLLGLLSSDSVPVALVCGLGAGVLHHILASKPIPGRRVLEWAVAALTSVLVLWEALILMALGPLLLSLLVIVWILPNRWLRALPGKPWRSEPKGQTSDEPQSLFLSIGFGLCLALALLAGGLASLGSQATSPLRSLDWLFVDLLRRGVMGPTILTLLLVSASLYMRSLLLSVELGFGSKKSPPLFLLGCSGALLGIGILTSTALRQRELPSNDTPTLETIQAGASYFDLGWDEELQLLLATQRETNRLELFDLSSGPARRVSAWGPGAGPEGRALIRESDSLEAVFGPAAGRFWVGVVQPDGGHALLSIHPTTGPEERLELGNCNPTSWLALPPTGDGQEQALVGCEASGAGLLLSTSQARIHGRKALPRGAEGLSLSPQGDRIFSYQLWGHPWLLALGWPETKVRDRRLLGPLTWGMAQTRDEGGKKLLWMARFLEGSLLALDPETLEVEAIIRLSPGLRALATSPHGNQLWAAASLSGQVWSLDSKAGWKPQAFSICGAPRNLRIDQANRALVASDCGLFRIQARPSDKSSEPAIGTATP